MALERESTRCVFLWSSALSPLSESLDHPRICSKSFVPQTALFPKSNTLEKPQAVRLFKLTQKTQQLCRFPIAERILHSRIRHITLEASRYEARSDQFIRDAHAFSMFPELDHGSNQFIQRCKFVTAHLPNLETASIFVEMSPDVLQQVKRHRKGQRAGFKAAVPWLRTVANIPAKKLRLEVLVCMPVVYWPYTERCRGEDCSNYSEAQSRMEKYLGWYFSPLGGEPFLEEEDFGLEALFREDCVLSLKSKFQFPGTGDLDDWEEFW